MNGAQGRSLPAIRGLRDTGASLHIGRSRPSVACATPVHPCTLESNHRHADFQSATSNPWVLIINELPGRPMPLIAVLCITVQD
jgi:hypothetical protein